jgi:DNA-binding NtrC family response regulator
MSAKRAILTVDDEVVLLLSIRQALKLKFGADYVYETAESAEDALGAIDRLTSEGVELALVISDWLMPGMRGDEFLKRVREILPSAKLVMMSGHADDVQMEALAAEAGLFAFMSKPYTAARLFDVVQRALAT